MCHFLPVLQESVKAMKKLFAVISGASVLLSVGLSNAAAARADSACTNATLTGGFGIQSTGTLVEGGPGPAGPFAANGLIKFDGNGNLTGNQTVSFNGTIAPFNSSGTYEVQEDCTLTLKITGDNGAQLTASGVIVKRGTEIFIIETDPLTVITGILKKVE